MMIDENQWTKITQTIDKALGAGALKRHYSHNMAFVFIEGQPVAMVKSGAGKDDPNRVHFRLSTFPGTAAFIGCLLQQHIEFLIAEHYEVDNTGKWLNEVDALRVMGLGPQIKKEFTSDQSEEDLNTFKKKYLLN